MNPLGPQLIAAIEATCGRLAIDNKDRILAIADKMTDTLTNSAISAFANGLPNGGVKSFEWGPIKNALLNSEPQIDATENQQIEDLFACLV